MKRAAIYVRVSTTDQQVGLQESELRQFAEQRGWEYQIFTDRGRSVAKVSRPALDDLLQRLRRKKFDVLAIWSLDRLARSLRQLLTIAEECRAAESGHRFAADAAAEVPAGVDALSAIVRYFT